MNSELRDLPRMAIFAVVVQEGGFTAAAKRLGLGKAAVSEQVSRLEASLGQRLLNRTTRRLSLTEAGDAHLPRCETALDAATESHDRARAQSSEPTGLLRLTTTSEFGTLRLAPLIASYAAAHPRVRIEMVLENGLLDLVEQRIDLAIRMGRLSDPSLISRKLGEADLWICAAPGVFDRAPVPKAPEDLSAHNWVLPSWTDRPGRLSLRGPGGSNHDLRIEGRVFCNLSEASRALILAGFGLGLAVDFAVAEDIAAGRLVRVLPDYHLPSLGIYALYPARPHLPLKVRSFLDHLVEQADWQAE